MEARWEPDGDQVEARPGGWQPDTQVGVGSAGTVRPLRIDGTKIVLFRGNIIKCLHKKETEMQM